MSDETDWSARANEARRDAFGEAWEGCWPTGGGDITRLKGV